MSLTSATHVALYPVSHHCFHNVINQSHTRRSVSSVAPLLPQRHQPEPHTSLCIQCRATASTTSTTSATHVALYPVSHHCFHDVINQRHTRRSVSSVAPFLLPTFKFLHQIVDRLVYAIRFIAYFMKCINEDVSDFCLVTVGNADNRTTKSMKMAPHS